MLKVVPDAQKSSCQNKMVNLVSLLHTMDEGNPCSKKIDCI